MLTPVVHAALPIITMRVRAGTRAMARVTVDRSSSTRDLRSLTRYAPWPQRKRYRPARGGPGRAAPEKRSISRAFTRPALSTALVSGLGSAREVSPPQGCPGPGAELLSTLRTGWDAPTSLPRDRPQLRLWDDGLASCRHRTSRAARWWTDGGASWPCFPLVRGPTLGRVSTSSLGEAPAGEQYSCREVWADISRLHAVGPGQHAQALLYDSRTSMVLWHRFCSASVRHRGRQSGCR